MRAEVMTSSSSSNKGLRPTVKEPPRRSYLPKRTRQIKLIPTAEALKLLSGTRVRFHRRVVRKMPFLEPQKWNLRNNVQQSAPNATSHSFAATHTGNPHQERIQIPNTDILRNLCGGSAEPDQNAGVGVSKTKGKGKAVVNKRKLGYEEDQSSGKLAYGVAKGYKP